MISYWNRLLIHNQRWLYIHQRMIVRTHNSGRTCRKKGQYRLETHLQQQSQLATTAEPEEDGENTGQNNGHAIQHRWTVSERVKSSAMWVRRSFQRQKIVLVPVCVFEMRKVNSFVLKQCEKNSQLNTSRNGSKGPKNS